MKTEPDDRPRRPPPLPSPAEGKAAFLGILKWVVLAIGGSLAFIAFTANAIQAGALAGLACFLGIVARIVQVEQHAAKKSRD